MKTLPKHKLRNLEEAAKGVATKGHWDGSHGAVWGGPDKELIANCYRSRDSYLIRQCGPDVVLELLRGYRLAKDAGLLVTSTPRGTP